MKEWSLFLISLGCLIMLLSSTITKEGYSGIMSGFLIIIVGCILFFRSKRGN